MDQAFIINIGQLLLGILFLVVGGEFLVRGSVSIANHFKISSLVIGLTVVAFGTSAPELMVSFDAALTGHPEIALGNVIGSNIANIALVLGLTVIILPMPVNQQTIKRSWPIMFLSGGLLFAFMSNNLIDQIEGVALFALLILFIISSIRSANKFPIHIKIPKPKNEHKIGFYVLMVIIASAGLAFGSKFLVNGASGLALNMGISERIISITVVAFGTSIPELTTSIIAAFRKESDISVGNIIGSNIFNVFAVIGITAGYRSIPLKFSEFSIDLTFMMIFYLLLLLSMMPLGFLFRNNGTSFASRYRAVTQGKISRIQGSIFVLLYVSYIILIFKS
ncbi:MAG: calcium/sodium antiporter [Prolixibacteraceae bacterium]